MEKFIAILLTLSLVACGDTETPEAKKEHVEDNPLVNMANTLGNKGLQDAQKHAEKMQKLVEQTGE